MTTKKQLPVKGHFGNYSSEMVRSLLEDNTQWTFWSEDWEKSLTVKWDTSIPLNKFRNLIVATLGKGFRYERSLMQNKVELEITAATYKNITVTR